jgi:hypothetical protein
MFLGNHTLGCGRCHDDKYDSISQRQVYQIYAFYNNTTEVWKNEASSIARS